MHGRNNKKYAEEMTGLFGRVKSPYGPYDTVCSERGHSSLLMSVSRLRKKIPRLETARHIFPGLKVL